MRRLLALSLAVFFLGASAGAKTVVPPAPKLRGAQSAVTAPAGARIKAPPTAAGVEPIRLWTAAGTDAAACRRACAQTRYFCDANGGSDDCGSSWSQCSAACSSPNLAATGLRGATE